MSQMIFTSESVSEGHPDKIADQVSDAILDALLKDDPQSRVACETLVKSGMTLIAGEITTNAWVDLEEITRNTILGIGYDKPEYGFNGATCAVISSIGKQSIDIAKGVDAGADKSLGAGDQGLMFGYATNETESFMPAPVTFSHHLMQKQAELRKSKKLEWLRPDAKAQVTLRYENGKPHSIDCIVVSSQHDPDISLDRLKEAIIEEIIKPVIPAQYLTQHTKMLINPAGRFVIGGPVGDCGLTGRKIIVDTYGGMARHGGGCFSGKDPSKVDRSAAYAARHVAKNVVAAGLADRCEVQVSYAIGVSEPTSISVETFGTGKIDDEEISRRIAANFDLSPQGIIESLDLLKPVYQPTAAYGHFGRDEAQFSWERLDKVDALT